MSRFVHVALELGTLAEVEAALHALALPLERSDDGVALRGSVECGDEPVTLRLPAGTLDAAEDFGFVADAHGLATLVCGEPDRAHLQRALVQPLLACVAQARVAAAAGLQITALEREADGTVRLRVQPRARRS
ncbi:MAG: hypothetical protein K1X88_26320 [Nannocystaceae bacterium]|nr:hypothetical protein [Nannocystaceae bacterium]